MYTFSLPIKPSTALNHVGFCCTKIANCASILMVFYALNLAYKMFLCTQIVITLPICCNSSHASSSIYRSTILVSMSIMLSGILCIVLFS